MLDITKLRAQIAAAQHQPPWCVYPPGDRWGAGIGARSTKYTIGGFEFGCDDELAVAAVNALPSLLAVYEAACAWHDDRDGAVLHHERGVVDRLIDAVAAARSAL